MWRANGDQRWFGRCTSMEPRWLLAPNAPRDRGLSRRFPFSRNLPPRLFNSETRPPFYPSMSSKVLCVRLWLCPNHACIWLDGITDSLPVQNEASAFCICGRAAAKAGGDRSRGPGAEKIPERCRVCLLAPEFSSWTGKRKCSIARRARADGGRGNPPGERAISPLQELVLGFLS
jgi:hypothetical protein